MKTYQKVTGPIMANSHPGSYTGQDAFSDMLVAGDASEMDSLINSGGGALTGALNCMHDQQIIVGVKKSESRKYVVRRLTPLECCRLQGFPDWWEDGVDGSDSARYKMWGNGIALPCAAFVLNRIAEHIRNG